MTTDDYSENIDWDIIYGAFHDPQGVASRILHELKYGSTPNYFLWLSRDVCKGMLKRHFQERLTHPQTAGLSNKRFRSWFASLA